MMHRKPDRRQEDVPDSRPAPQITIQESPGWPLDAPNDWLGDPDEAPQGRPSSWLDRHRFGGLALASVLGFVTATGLADLRTSTLEESSDGALSLEVRFDINVRPDVVTAADGRSSLATYVMIRNTGPRPVAFARAELLGTSYRSDDLRGRRVADGGETVVVLLRSIDCSHLDHTPVPGRLRVHATTGAGKRTVDLPIRLEVEDCTRYRPPFTDAEPAVLLWFTGGRIGHGFGSDPTVLQQLSEAACADGQLS